MMRAMKAPLGRPAYVRGLGLLEVMVGIVVGMLAVVVILQALQVVEAQRRTTTGTGDAQTTGAIALSLLQQDIQQAGNGLMDANLLGCALTLPSGGSIANLGPLTINHPSIPAGDSGSETLLVVYGNPSGALAGNRILATPAANTYSMESTRAFQQNDWVVAAPENRPAICNLIMTQVVNAPNAAATPVVVNTGILNARWGFLFNLGLNPVARGYAIRGGRLTTCNLLLVDCSVVNSNTWLPIAEDVVVMRALYSHDTSVPADGVPDVSNATTPNTPGGWAAMRALRIVVVARSAHLQREDVTDAAAGAPAPTWSAAGLAPIAIPGSDWKRFRYRVFEATLAQPNSPVALPTGTWITKS